MLISCPKCGTRLLKGEKATQLEIKCPKCSCFIDINISKAEVTYSIKESGN